MLTTSQQKNAVWAFLPAWLCFISSSTDGNSWSRCLFGAAQRAPRSLIPGSSGMAFLLPEQTFSQCMEPSAWHSSGYKYLGVFHISGQEYQCCIRWALAALSGFCSALVSFSLCSGIKIIEIPWMDCLCPFGAVTSCWQLLLSGPSEGGTSKLQHVWNHPSASPRGFGLRVSGSRRWSPPKCSILEMCYRSLWCFPVSSVSV